MILSPMDVPRMLGTLFVLASAVASGVGGVWPLGGVVGTDFSSASGVEGDLLERRRSARLDMESPFMRVGYKEPRPAHQPVLGVFGVHFTAA